jgi:hypothetical protein
MEPVRAVRNAGRLGRKTKLKHRLKIGIGLQRCESVQNYRWRMGCGSSVA